MKKYEFIADDKNFKFINRLSLIETNGLWLDSASLPFAKTKKFIIALFNSKIKDSWHWFDNLPKMSFRRQTVDLTIETYTKHMKKENMQ